MPPIVKCEVDECIYWQEGNNCCKQVITLRKTIATIVDVDGMQPDEHTLLGAMCPEIGDVEWDDPDEVA